MLSWRNVLSKKRAEAPQILESEADITWGFALESRMLFDGAVAATVDQTASTQQADSSSSEAASSDATAESSTQSDTSQEQATSGTDSQTSDNQSDATDLAVASDPARKEVVFIDTSVADYQSLVNGVKSGVEVVLLDASEDGLSQIAVWAQTHSGYDAIHIISNGGEGSLNLGNITLDSSSLSSRSADLAVIGSALTDSGDILLYGCDVAQGSEGQAFISDLAALTSADVAASDDLTGAAALNGDWTLEAQVGEIESSNALTDTAQSSYGYVLDTFTFNGTENVSSSNSVTYQEGNVTLHFDFVGSVSPYLYDGIYYVATNGSSSTFTITIPGYIFDLSSLDLQNNDDIYTQSYTITSSDSGVGDSKSGTLAYPADGTTFTTISGFNSTFTGVSSITITSSGSYQYALDNLVLNNIRVASNTAPVISNTAVSKTFNEDTSQTFTAGDFGFSDADSSDTLQSITIVTAPAAGQLFIDANGDGTYGSGDTLVTSGAVVSTADISKLTFRPAENANGSGYASFTWTVSDGTDSSANTGTMTLNVTAVNDAPVISNTVVSKTFNEDISQTFTTADFGFSDVDSGDTLQSITIVTAPTAGQLFIDADGDGLYGSGDTLIGDGAVISAANISKLTFRPAENANGSGYASFTWTVSDGTDSSANTGTMTFNVIAVNDAPVISNTAVSKTFNEDTAQTFTSADFGFTDVDSGDTLQSITIVTAPSAGQLFIDANGDGVYGSGDTLVTSGAVISAANISKLTFRPAENANGSGYASFTWKVSDGTVNSANTGTMTLNVTAVNDAPTISDTSVTKSVVSDSVLSFTAADFGFSDVDSGDTLQSITLLTAPAQGTLFLDVDSNGSYDSQTDFVLNAGVTIGANALAYIKYQPDSGAVGNGYASFTWTVSDGQASSSDIGTMTIDVTAANNIPTVTTNGGSLNLYEDTPVRLSSLIFGFSDQDSGDTLQSITLVTVPAKGQLFIDNNGDGQYNSGDSLMTNGTTVAAADISKLVYQSPANDNGNNYTTMSWTVSDGKASSAVATMNFNIIAVNDAPVISNTAVSKTFNEDTSQTFTTTDFGFSDVDSGDTLQSITIVTAPTAGQLFIDADGDGMYGSGDTLVTSGAVVSAANISKLTFRPAENANGTGYASFTWKVSDGTVNSTNTGTMTLNVTAVNDVPTISDTSVTKSVVSDSALSFTAADFGFSDVDSGDSLQFITIVTVPAQGALFIDADSNGSYDPQIDFSISAGTNISTAGIAFLKYQPDSGASGNGYASFSWKVSDGQVSSSDTGTMTIDVTAANTAPTISNPSVTKTVNEDTPLTFSAGDFGFSDTDSGDTLNSITIVTTPAHGQLFIDTDGDGQYNAGDTLLGNGAVVSAANIAKLTFVPEVNENGAGYTSFTWKVNDGTVDSSDTGTLTINVTAVNDAPTISNPAVTKTVNEDTPLTFSAGDFGFSDVDSGDTLQSITIVTAPAHGQLFIDANGDGKFGAGDTLLGNGAVVSAANIAKLTFVPAANENGAGYTSFSWKVNDGTVNSTDTGTLTINVTAVNDAPVAHAIANQSVTAGNTFSLVLANGAFTDVNGDTLTLSATLANGSPLPAWLTFDPATGTFSGTPAQGDIGSLTLRVTATDPSLASASTTFSLSVTRITQNDSVQNGGDPEFRMNDGRTPPPLGQGSLRLNVGPVTPVTLGALFTPAALGALNSSGAPDTTVTAALFQAARTSTPDGNAPVSQLAGSFAHASQDGGASQFDSALGTFPSFNNGGALGGSSSLSGLFSGIHLPSISTMEVFSGGSWRDITTSSDLGESALRFSPGLQWQLQQSGEEAVQRLAAIEQALNEMDQRQA